MSGRHGGRGPGRGRKPAQRPGDAPEQLRFSVQDLDLKVSLPDPSPARPLAGLTETEYSRWDALQDSLRRTLSDGTQAGVTRAEWLLGKGFSWVPARETELLRLLGEDCRAVGPEGVEPYGWLYVPGSRESRAWFRPPWPGFGMKQFLGLVALHAAALVGAPELAWYDWDAADPAEMSPMVFVAACEAALREGPERAEARLVLSELSREAVAEGRSPETTTGRVAQAVSGLLKLKKGRAATLPPGPGPGPGLVPP